MLVFRIRLRQIGRDVADLFAVRPGRASKAAEALKITSEDLVALGIIDEVVREPTGAAHADPVQATELVKAAILKNLKNLDRLSSQQRRDLRYQKFRNIGKFAEVIQLE